MRTLLVLTLALLLAVPAAAQPDRWQAYPSLRSIQALAASDDAVWAGTGGGVFRYTPATGEIERYTTVRGLTAVNVSALAYDAARNALWIGYPDGGLDRLDIETGAVEAFFDIARADRYTARGINRIEVVSDSLLVSTDFGVVVFDAVAGEVRDTYERFGTLEGGVSARDVLLAPLPDGTPGVWVATAEGVVYAPQSAPNLREPSVWTLDAGSPERGLSLAYFEGQVWAGVEQFESLRGDVRFRTGEGLWQQGGYTDRSVYDLFVEGDRLIAISLFFVYTRLGGEVGRTRLQEEGTFMSLQAGVLGPDGRLWGGDDFLGLLAFPELVTSGNANLPPAEVVIPDGPLSNVVLDLDLAAEGEVWVGYETTSPRSNGFGRFDGTAWSFFSEGNGALSRRASIMDVHAGSDGSVWFGTEGAGLYHYAADGEITRYTPENSTLQPAATDPAYTVVRGVATDEEGRLWATNRFSSQPLHVRTPDGTWTGLSRPSGAPSSVEYGGLYIDSFGQKWISGVGGRGFLVLHTGNDPTDVSDDRVVYVGPSSTVGTGLPDPAVNAFAEDLDGRMWIGTNRGLAVVFSPGSVFAGNQGLAEPQWARTADGRCCFLRDLRIFDIAVDPANGKWLASSSGLWLLNAEGNEIVRHFTAENSPLPSNEVVAVEVDPASGAVYVATSGGVYRWRGDAVAAAPRVEDLRVYPNPYRPVEHPEGVLVRGLVDETEVRILTVDGQVVASFRTRGGSARWDGRDQRTGQPVPSGVYIVAADAEGGAGTAYGKVAVIR